MCQRPCYHSNLATFAMSPLTPHPVAFTWPGVCGAHGRECCKVHAYSSLQCGSANGLCNCRYRAIVEEVLDHNLPPPSVSVPSSPSLLLPVSPSCRCSLSRWAVAGSGRHRPGHRHRVPTWPHGLKPSWQVPIEEDTLDVLQRQRFPAGEEAAAPGHFPMKLARRL